MGNCLQREALLVRYSGFEITLELGDDQLSMNLGLDICMGAS